MINKETPSLGSFISIKKGKKHSTQESKGESSTRVISIEDLRHDGVIKYTEDSKGTKVDKNDVLIAWDGANAGTIGYGKSGFAGSTIARLRINDPKQLDSTFLGLLLRSKLTYLRKNATGATIPHISRPSLERIELPKIKLEDQQRIAYLLSKVEGLIAQRKQHLQDLDDFLKSVFLDMFSPSKAEDENWPYVEIKTLASNHKGAMRTGPFGSNLLHSEFVSEGPVAVLGIDNAVNNQFCWGERRFITASKYQELKNYTIHPRDVIVTIMGTIGRSAVIPDDIPLAINTKHLAAITLNKEIANPIFLSFAIHSSPYILKQFKARTRGAIMSGLNLTIIKETKIYRPPIDLQNLFEERYIKTQNIINRIKNSLSNLENLYGSLSQKAFAGELDLSKVHLTFEVQHMGTSSIHGKEDSESISEMVLPKLSEHDANTEEGREQMIEKWFEFYQNERGKEAIETHRFVDLVNRRLEDLMDDPVSVDVGVYDKLSKVVYDKLSAKNLRQKFDKDTNTIQLIRS
ncbi:MAG: restriction endonuclease subunit S [Verrucomicrobiota bacterium]